MDGSYLYKKRKQLEDVMVSSLEVPSAPGSGWEHLMEANASDVAKKLPCVTAGVVYTYLSAHAGRKVVRGRSELSHVDTRTGHRVALIV